MPNYEYKCNECGHVFSLFQSMKDEPIKECPECKGEVRKLFGASGIIFKGSGFYVNDYKKSSDSQKSKPENCPSDCNSCRAG